MPAHSLVHLAQVACIKNKRSLTDVGDFEYWKIKSVLEAIESPTQLHTIETNSPQIQGETAELWQKLIARDIPNWQAKNYAPKNPVNWYKVYNKYKREQEADIKRDAEVLMASMAGIKNKRMANVSQVLDLRSLPKLPRDPKMQYDAGVKIGRKGFKKDAPSSLVWSGGSKTKLTDGKSVLTKARREAKEMSQRNKLAKPTHQLGGRLGQITKAPAGMVSEYRRSGEPPLKIMSQKQHFASANEGQLRASGPSLEEREKRLRSLNSPRKPVNFNSDLQERERLRALTSAKIYTPPAGATILSSGSDLDTEDSFDDLFDESPRSAKPSTSSRQHSTPSSTYPRLDQSSSSSRKPPSKERDRQYIRPSSPPFRSSTKPSEVISSMIRKPRPDPSSSSPPSTTPRRSAPAGVRRSPSPAPGEKKPPMIQRRKRPVDIFNRTVKRPRLA